MVLQMQDSASGGHFQISMSVEVSRFQFLKMGKVSYWIPQLEPKYQVAQEELLSCFQCLCRQHSGVMSLHIHVYVPGDTNHLWSSSTLLKQGWRVAQRQYAERTRLMDLRVSPEILLQRFSKRVRMKFEIKEDDELEYKPIASADQIPHMQAALNDSFHRSIHSGYNYDFTGAINLVQKYPDSSLVWGAAFKDTVSETPIRLASETPMCHRLASETPQYLRLATKAFSIGMMSAGLCEYSQSGSRSDARLRRHDFNYMLMWKLISGAQALGAQIFDLGGITSGDPSDPLAGISQFKRRFPGFEVEIGTEFDISLKPFCLLIFLLLRKLRSILGR